MQQQALNSSCVSIVYGTKNKYPDRTQNFREIKEVENYKKRNIQRDNKKVNEEKMKKEWTEGEINILLDLYKNNSLSQLSKLLNRSESSIQHKALKLKLLRREKREDWTQEDTKRLKENYADNINKEIIKLIPNKTIRSIQSKADRLGLKKSYNALIKFNPNKRFNHIDNEKIRELRNEGLTALAISKKLGCSTELIKKRYKEIGIKGLAHKDYMRYKGLDLNKDLIKNLYLNEKKSIKYIAKIMNCSPDAIIRRLIEMNIKRFICKKKLDLEIINNLIELYQEGNSIYEIEKITNIHNQRVFQYLRRNNIKLRDMKNAKKIEWSKNREGKIENMRKINKERYSDPEFLKRYKEAMNRKPNKPEIMLDTLIKENNLPFNYVGDGQVWIGGFNPDFLSKNPKHIIEVYGDYWHANPNIYSDLTKGQLKQRDKDKRRLEAYSSLGYKTLIIWENELKNPQEVLDRIKRFINE